MLGKAITGEAGKRQLSSYSRLASTRPVMPEGRFGKESMGDTLTSQNYSSAGFRSCQLYSNSLAVYSLSKTGLLKFGSYLGAGSWATLSNMEVTNERASVSSWRRSSMASSSAAMRSRAAFYSRRAFFSRSKVIYSEARRALASSKAFWFRLGTSYCFKDIIDF